jgi:hypothetical protein
MRIRPACTCSPLRCSNSSMTSAKRPLVTQMSSGGSSRSSREWHYQLGLLLMICCCTRGIYSFHRRQNSGHRSLILRMGRAMRVLKRHFNGCVTPSSIPMQHVGFMILSKVAARVNATSLKIFTRWGCCTLWRFLVRSGLILQWTLLKVFQNQEASQ